MVATITTTGLKADHAIGVLLPAQRLVDTDSISLPFSDSTLIQEARIRSGTFAMEMVSDIDIDLTFRFRFKELFHTIAGEELPFEDSVFVSRHGSTTYSFNISGYDVRSLNGQLLSSLEVISTVVIPVSGNQPITLNDSDGVHVSLTHTAPIVIDSAIGVVPPTWVDVATVVPLELSDFSTKFKAQLSLPFALLNLSTLSSIGFPIDLAMSLGAKGEAGDSAVLPIPASQQRIQPGMGFIQFDEASVGQFLSRLSGTLPDSIGIKGRVLVNPPDVYIPSLAGIGHVGSNCGLSGRVDLQIPLTVGIANGTYSDTLAVGDSAGSGGLNPSDKDRLGDVNSGTVHVEIENGTPLQLAVSLSVLDSLGRQLLLLPGSGQGFGITGAIVDAQGNVSTPTRSKFAIQLGGNDVQQFIDAHRIAYNVSFVTTPGAPSVAIRTTDSIKIKAWSGFSYRVSDQ